MRVLPTSIAASLAALTLCVCALVGATNPPAYDLPWGTPEWLTNAVNRQPGNLADGADAIWLTRDKTLEVGHDGSLDYEVHSALKILQWNGVGAAEVKIFFNDRKDDVSGLDAWLIFPDGTTRRYGKLDCFVGENRGGNMKSTPEKLYYMGFIQAAKPGTILAWSFHLRRSYSVVEDVWYPADPLPTLHSSFDITLPRKWTLTATPVNDPKFTQSTGTPTDDVQTYHYECTNVPATEPEDGTPKERELSFIGFNFARPDDQPGVSHSWTYKTWNQIATFEAGYMDKTVIVDDAIRAKVTELTKDCDTPLKRIRAICRYVQTLNSIDTDWGSTNGILGMPDTAPTVFAHHYGDCKNKVTLLRAMLSCIGVESFTAEVATNEKANPAYPSTSQIYSCIAAIKAPDGVETNADLIHPKLGRLILFDPANAFMPFGAIAQRLEGLNMLVASKDCDGLVHIPSARSGETISWQGEIDNAGNVNGTEQIVEQGGMAGDQHKLFSEHPRSELTDVFEKCLCTQSLETKITNLETKDDFDNNTSGLNLSFRSRGYAHVIGGRLLSLGLFNDGYTLPTPGKSKSGKRLTPYYLRDCTVVRDAVITFPKNYSVDELPDDISETTPYGSVELHCTSDGNKIHAHLEIKAKETWVRPEDIDALRSFIMEADRALCSATVLCPQ